MKSKPFFLMQVSIVFLTCAANDTSDFVVYLKQKHGITVTPDTRITCHTKDDVRKEFQSRPWSDAEKEKNLNKAWSSGLTKFIDSVYTLDSAGQFHGAFIDFTGDSAGGFTRKHFFHGKKDSIWIKQFSDGTQKIERYEDGKPHGVWESVHKDGTKGYLKKYKQGQMVDTSYNWWPNGNLMEMEVFDNGRSIQQKCFAEDGKREIECGE